MSIKYDYHATWNDFINAWLDEKQTVSTENFLEFYNLVYLFRMAFEKLETTSLDIRETLAEFLGIV